MAGLKASYLAGSTEKLIEFANRLLQLPLFHNKIIAGTANPLLYISSLVLWSSPSPDSWLVSGALLADMGELTLANTLIDSCEGTALSVAEEVEVDALCAWVLPIRLTRGGALPGQFGRWYIDADAY